MLMIRWGFMPPEIRAAVRPVLVDYLWLIPSWSRLLYVHYKHAHDTIEGAEAAVSADPEYRQSRLTVFAGWLVSNPTQRRLAILHELVHVPLAPMVIEQEQSLTRLVGEDAPKFHASLQESWRRAFEGTVQDLAYSIAEIPLDHLPRCAFTE